MKSVVKIFSFLIIILSILIIIVMKGITFYDKEVQNRIIDNIYIKKVDDDISYLGYIYIPKYDIKRLIKDGCDSSILDSGYVGKHGLSSDDFLILAGHNVPNVFGVLHKMVIGDILYVNNSISSRKFVVSDMLYVNEYEMDYLRNNSGYQLLLITCSDKKGERLIVRLKEVI